MTKQKTFYIKTWGCAMNVYDSDKICTILTDAGYEKVEEASKADIIILNTCSIRENADDKLFSFLGRLEKANSKAIKIVAGCVAQTQSKDILKRTNADIVVGTHMYHKIPQMIKDLKENQKITDIEFKPNEKFDALPIKQISSVVLTAHLDS